MAEIELIGLQFTTDLNRKFFIEESSRISGEYHHSLRVSVILESPGGATLQTYEPPDEAMYDAYDAMLRDIAGLVMLIGSPVEYGPPHA